MEAADKKKALLLAAASVESEEGDNSDDDFNDGKPPALSVLNSNPKIIRCSWPVCIETVEGKDVERSLHHHIMHGNTSNGNIKNIVCCKEELLLRNCP